MKRWIVGHKYGHPIVKPDDKRIKLTDGASTYWDWQKRRTVVVANEKPEDFANGQKWTELSQ